MKTEPAPSLGSSIGPVEPVLLMVLVLVPLKEVGCYNPEIPSQRIRTSDPEEHLRPKENQEVEPGKVPEGSLKNR